MAHKPVFRNYDEIINHLLSQGFKLGDRVYVKLMGKPTSLRAVNIFRVSGRLTFMERTLDGFGLFLLVYTTKSGRTTFSGRDILELVVLEEDI